MDAPRFDAVARSLASARSRRSFLRGLLGGGIAVVAASQATPAAAACIPPGPRNFCNFDVECCANAICSGGACSCRSGYKTCGTACIPTTQTCLVCGAGGPIKPCANGCTDTRTDRNNCGYCGNACGTKETCSNGRCCPFGTISCGGVCKPLSQCQ